MTTLRDLLKDRKLYSVETTRTVLEAARFMMENNIGALPVLRDGQLVGILSERDIMNRVVAVGRTPGTTAVSEVMTPNPRAVEADETVEECMFLMREFGFRHLPIVEGKELKGLVSLRDILMHRAAEVENQPQRAASEFPQVRRPSPKARRLAFRAQFTVKLTVGLVVVPVLLEVLPLLSTPVTV